MTLDACAELVAKGDPDRFMALMAAPRKVRRFFLPLFAFNLEIVRAPWASSEPMIAEMRLQWWADTVDRLDRVIPAHEVAAPLAELVRERNLPRALLSEMVDARRADIYGDQPTVKEFSTYLNVTSGHLMWLCSLASEGNGPEDAIRDIAWADGLARMLRAVPELRSLGRMPLPDTDITELIHEGIRRERRGRKHAKEPATLAAWQSSFILKSAYADPRRIDEGGMEMSEFRRRMTLAYRSIRH